MPETFESALQARSDAMADACTRRGKCVEVCPTTEAAGVDAEPRTVIDGVIDILRHGEGNEAARKWASSCALSGECIKACDYGVNPRFLLGMARDAMARVAARSCANGSSAPRPTRPAVSVKAKGLFVVESECPQFLRTVPVLPRDPRYPDRISDAAKNHLADACRYGLRFDLTPAFSTRPRWVA